MQPDQPFRPGDRTYIIAAAATAAASGATLMGSGLAGEVDYVIYNKGVNDAWLAYGMTSGAAIGNAVIPLIGSPSAALPCPAGTIQTFTLQGSLFFTAIAEVGLSSISVTPGYGA